MGLWLTPGNYALIVMAHDAAGRKVAQSRTRFQVELPAFARQVRVLGTSDNALGSDGGGSQPFETPRGMPTCMTLYVHSCNVYRCVFLAPTTRY